MRRTLVVAVAGLLASMSWTASYAQGASDSVSVDGAYVRAVPPGQPNSGAFMTLTNQDSAGHAVVSAESPAAKVVELHTHIHEGGMMMMRRIEKIDIAANTTTELKPGGLHVMLIGLTQELKPGSDVEITLVFEDGSSKQITAPVQNIMMQMNMHQGGMQHNMH